MDNIIKKAMEDSTNNLKRELGLNCTPSVEQIINYLEEKAEFKLPGKCGTECTVNKEALRLAAVYLQDAYCYYLDL